MQIQLCVLEEEVKELTAVMDSIIFLINLVFAPRNLVFFLGEALVFLRSWSSELLPSVLSYDTDCVFQMRQPFLGSHIDSLQFGLA